MIKAVLFDMDGVLVDSEDFIREAAVGMFREKGYSVKAEDFIPFTGTGENRFLGGVAEKYGFVDALVESWQDGVPEFRPRFAEWPQMTEIVQEWGTKIMLGDVTTEQGAKEIGTRVEALLKDAGYYDGKKPLAQ